MNGKGLLKTYTFWVAVLSGIFLLVQRILKCFGISITEESYMIAVESVLGVFVMAGILIAPPKKEENEQETLETEDEQKENTKVLKSIEILSQNPKIKTKSQNDSSNKKF